MAFGQNNNFNKNQNGDKKRTNFPINKFWGTNGRLELTMWLADGGAITIFTIKQEVGKDPSTNASVLENKGPNELPKFYLRMGELRGLIDVLEENVNKSDFSLCRDKGNDKGKITFDMRNNVLTITIDGTKQGSRTLTIDSISFGTSAKNAELKNIIESLKIAYKKSLTAKLDPEAFAFAVNGGGDDDTQTPF